MFGFHFSSGRGSHGALVGICGSAGRRELGAGCHAAGHANQRARSGRKRPSGAVEPSGCASRRSGRSAEYTHTAVQRGQHDAVPAGAGAAA